MVFDNWIALTLILVVFVAITAVVQKKILMKEHAMESMAVFGLFIALLSIPVFFFIDYSLLTGFMIVMVLFTALPSSIGTVFFAKGMRDVDVGSAMSLWVVGPGIVALLAFIFLGEALTFLQVSGIFLLIVGSYILESKDHQTFFEPFKVIRKNKGVYHILLGMLFLSISAVMSRYVLSDLGMQVNSFVAFSLSFAGLFMISFLFIFHDGVTGLRKGIKNFGWLIFLVAFLTFLASFLQSGAIQLAPVGLVLSIKRLSTLLVIIIGKEMFHEKKIYRKMVSAVIMIAGVMLILV